MGEKKTTLSDFEPPTIALEGCFETPTAAVDSESGPKTVPKT